MWESNCCTWLITLFCFFSIFFFRTWKNPLTRPGRTTKLSCMFALCVLAEHVCIHICPFLQITFCLWAVAIIRCIYSNLKAPLKSMRKIIFSPTDVKLMWNKHWQTLFASSDEFVINIQIFVLFFFPLCIPYNLSVQRSRRKNVSMPSSTAWSEQRSLVLRSPRRWRKNGGFSNYRCVRSVVHLTWLENPSFSPETCHSC